MRPTENTRANPRLAAGPALPIDRAGPEGSPPASQIDREHPIGFLIHVVSIVWRLVGTIVGFGRRRRPRASMHAWTALDNRLLADIGVRRADVLAVMLGIVPAAQLRGRSDSAIVAWSYTERPPATSPHGQVLALDPAAPWNAAA
jgi:uncharacterized protein YjiS (DUF1127 family)